MERKMKDYFYESRTWNELRYQALRRDKFTCMSCGADRNDHIKLHVDHIKPRSKYPELELDLDNLQTLCSDCNLGKGAKFQDDLRLIQKECILKLRSMWTSEFYEICPHPEMPHIPEDISDEKFVVRWRKFRTEMAKFYDKLDEFIKEKELQNAHLIEW
jgi:hypothetical protein